MLFSLVRTYQGKPKTWNRLIYETVKRERTMDARLRLKVRHFVGSDKNRKMLPGKRDTIAKGKVKRAETCIEQYNFKQIHEVFVSENKINPIQYAIPKNSESKVSFMKSVPKREECWTCPHIVEVLIKGLQHSGI